MTRDEKAAHDKAWNTRHANLVARGDAWVKKNAKVIENQMMAGAPGSAGFYVRPREDARDGHVIKYGPFKTEEQAKHAGSIIDNVCVEGVHPEHYEAHEARYFLEAPEELGYKSSKILHPSKAPYHEGFKEYGGGWHSALVAVAKHERMGPWADEGAKMNDLDLANGIIARFSDVLEPQEIAEIAAAGMGDGLRPLVADFVIEMFSERQVRDEAAAHEKAWATRKRTVAQRNDALFGVVKAAREGGLALSKLAEDQKKRGVKGECYPTAYRHLRIDDEDKKLVHGTVHPVGGERMLHAWVENHDGSVFEPEHGKTWSKDEFEKHYRPDAHAKFSPLESRIAMVRQGHMGPWPAGSGTPKKQPPKFSVIGTGKLAAYRDEAEAHRKAWDTRGRDQHDEHVKGRFDSVAHYQRGLPESAMLEIAQASGGGIVAMLAEHVGDLTHRMAERITYDSGGISAVHEKLEKTLRWLEYPYALRKEWSDFLASNAKYRKVPLAEFVAPVDAALARYADEHRKVPAFNHAQRLARDAAVAVGEKHFARAKEKLQELKDIMDNGQEAWVEAMHKNYSVNERVAQLRGAFDEALSLFRDEKSAHAKAWAKRKRAAPTKAKAVVKKKTPLAKTKLVVPEPAVKIKTTNWSKQANAENHAAYLKNTGQAHHTVVVPSESDPSKFVVHAKHWDGAAWGPTIIHESETRKYPKSTNWHSKAEVNRALDPYTAKHLDSWIERVASPDDREKIRKQITDYVVKDPSVLIDKTKSFPGAQQLKTWREIYNVAKVAGERMSAVEGRIAQLRAAAR